MTRKRYFFFDLDGTLTNSGRGIINAVRYAIRKMGLPMPDEETLRLFVGPPLRRAMMEHCGVDEETAVRTVACYREYYNDTGIYESEVYDGVTGMLDAARATGAKLVIASCKPIPYSERVVKHFGLDGYFDFIAGAEFDGRRSEKHEVIRFGLEHYGLTSPDDVLMIGDRVDDIAGAAENGVESVGVLWGFGSREELVGAGAGHLAASPAELARFLTESAKNP